MARLMLLVLALAAAGPAAAEMSVFSPRAANVSVTIYRDGLALITETREVDLPADAATVVFEGVVDRLLSQSAVLTGADRPLAESNLTFDPLNAASLVQRSVGKVVTLVRTQRKTGKITRTQMTIVSADQGVLLQSVDGTEALYCSGLPERLEFSEIPGELTPKPVLSIKLAAGAPGKRTVKLSYITHGFSWESNYAGRLNERGNRMALTGWVTLKNETNVSFKDAQVQLVAGKLNLLDAEEGGSRPVNESLYYEDDEQDEPGVSAFDRLAEREADAIESQLSLLNSCFARPLPPAAPPPPSPEYQYNFRAREDVMYDSPMAVMVTAARVVRESFADYQLYRLPWPTDLNARQTKQAVFLDKRRVKVERFYSVQIADFASTPWDPQASPNLMLRWENKTSAGLGEPLPKGRVRIFEPLDQHEVFAGEAELEDKAVGLPVEITVARAMNLAMSFEQEAKDQDKVDSSARVTLTNAFHFFNGKAVPVTIEVRHGSGSGGFWTSPEVLESNLRTGKKYGDLAWRFRVPPGADQLLRYTLRANIND